MVEWLAGNRIRGLDSEKMQVVAFNPVTGYGTAVLNDGGVVSGYNTYTYLNNGASEIVLSVSATVEVLLVGAGGMGRLDEGGGGGGGAVMVSDTFTLPAGTHALSVAPQNRGTAGITSSPSGASSTFYGITCTGGAGAGSSHANGVGGTLHNNYSTPSAGTAPTFPSGITGTVYAGYSGGSSANGGSSGGGGGGGGGSNQTGQVGASGQAGGNGGNGIQLTGFESVSYYYGGGGGGAGRGSGSGAGGLGGGGGGATNSGSESFGAGGTGGRNVGTIGQLYQGGGNGGDNTGSGGGGGNNGTSGAGKCYGGSGIIVIKISSQNSVPLDVQDGSIFYTTDTNKSYVLNSGTWTEL